MHVSLSIPDIINGLFELFGGIVVFSGTLHAWRVGVVKGVHIGVVWYFWAWGLWNTFYYPHLAQNFSFWCGVLILLANTLWLYTVYRLRVVDNVD